MAIANLSAERLRELLHYSPETGQFTWLVQRGKVKVGDIARVVHPTGYRRICVDGTRYFAHRLAWLYVHGQWPEQFIDHINGDKLDNRLANLRDVDASVNQYNRHTVNNMTGHIGAKKHRNRFNAQIHVDGKYKYLGNYTTPEEAAAARLAAIAGLPLPKPIPPTRKTHCKNGHEYTAESTFLTREGFRKCRTCRYERQRLKD